MEPASTHEHAQPGEPAPASTGVQGSRDDRRLAMQFLGIVLAIYVVIGLAIYGMVAALL